jgi:hypothetical protein
MRNDECGMKRGTGRGRRCLGRCVLTSAFCVALAGGCSKPAASAGPASRPSTLRERQDSALKDPFGYSPNVDRTDISGGGLSGFDRDGFGKDMKDVFNP